MIHPSSINSQLAIPDPQQGQSHPCHVVLYDEVTRGESQLYVRQCTAASPHALLMVAAHLGVSQDEDLEGEEEQPGQQTSSQQHLYCMEAITKDIVLVIDDTKAVHEESHSQCFRYSYSSEDCVCRI